MKKDTNASEKSKILMRTYITSLLSLMLCVTMLLGTTYAWFTSEVTTAGNEIAVGTLKVGLTDAEGDSLEKKTGLFGSGSFKWEPGATKIETFNVVNLGNLAFDYALYLSPLNSEVGDLLSAGKFIDVYITTNNAPAGTVEELKSNWIRVGNLADVAQNGYMLVNGSWTPNTPAVVAEDPATLATVKIALHLPGNVSDEKIMGAKITNLGVKLMASQKPFEDDDIAGDHDSEAAVVVNVSNETELAAAFNAGQQVNLTSDIKITENTTLTVPSGKQVVINMNDHNITSGYDDSSATQKMFLVKGNLIINGEKSSAATAAEGESTDPYESVISYTRTNTSSTESNGATIFEITADGLVQLKDVKAVNSAGDEMKTYVARLNNHGTASLYTEGCYLEADYCTVCVDNAGPALSNFVAKNTTLKGERALAVLKYTADDFGTDYDAEAVASRLNISIYNNNAIAGDVVYGTQNAEYHVTSGTAFAKCVEDGVAKIVLEDDVTFNEYSCEVKSDLVVDLNGNNIGATHNPNAGTGTTEELFHIKPGVIMTVEGEGNVKLTSKVEGNNNISVAIFRNEGNLNLNGGNYEVADSTVKVDGAWVVATIIDTCLNSGDAVTTINGGTYIVTGNAINLFRNYPTGTGATCKLIINDGVFNANPDKETVIWNQQNNANSNTKMEFNGGTYNAVFYEDYHGQDDITVTDAAKAGGLQPYSGNSGS